MSPGVPSDRGSLVKKRGLKKLKLKSLSKYQRGPKDIFPKETEIQVRAKTPKDNKLKEREQEREITNI